MAFRLHANLVYLKTKEDTAPVRGAQVAFVETPDSLLGHMN
jgi:hypothetical protein